MFVISFYRIFWSKWNVIRHFCLCLFIICLDMTYVVMYNICLAISHFTRFLWNSVNFSVISLCSFLFVSRFFLCCYSLPTYLQSPYLSSLKYSFFSLFNCSLIFAPLFYSLFHSGASYTYSLSPPPPIFRSPAHHLPFTVLISALHSRSLLTAALHSLLVSFVSILFAIAPSRASISFTSPPLYQVPNGSQFISHLTQF